MCEVRYTAEKTYSFSWMDMFDYWWENTGKLALNPKTPQGLIEGYREIARLSWNQSATTHDRCTEAVVVHPYACRG